MQGSPTPQTLSQSASWRIRSLRVFRLRSPCIGSPPNRSRLFEPGPEQSGPTPVALPQPEYRPWPRRRECPPRFALTHYVSALQSVASQTLSRSGSCRIRSLAFVSRLVESRTAHLVASHPLRGAGSLAPQCVAETRSATHSRFGSPARSARLRAAACAFAPNPMPLCRTRMLHRWHGTKSKSQCNLHRGE